MYKIIILLSVLIASRTAWPVSVPISTLPTLPAPSASPSDSVVGYSTVLGEPIKLLVSDLPNLPAFTTKWNYVNPMTTVGDLMYENSTPAPARLGGNTTATKNFLCETGTGSAANAPSWCAISSSDVPTLNQNTSGSAASLSQTITSGLPVIGNGTGIIAGTKSGNTTKFATTTGTLTSGDCVKLDASGNFIDSGVAGCGSSLIFADSLSNSGGTVTLQNDSASPSASSYYGTDGSSILGYHPIPVTGVTVQNLPGSTTLSATTTIQAPNNQVTANGTGNAIIETGSDNLLANPSFQAGVANASWTFAGSGVSGARITSGTYGKDQQDLQLTLSSASGDLLYQDVTVPSGSINQVNEENSLVINTTVAGLQVCARIGAVDLNCVSVPTGGAWAYVPASSVGGSSTTSIGVSLYAASAVSGTVSVSRGYVGPNRTLGTVAQAQLLGQVKITGCSSQWSTTSTSFAAFSAQTGCTYTVTPGTRCTAPGTNVPGLTCANIAPGNITLRYEGTWNNSTSSKNAYLQFTDGTNAALETSEGGTGGSVNNGITQSITYSSPQSSVTFQMYGKSDSAGTTQVFGTTGNPGVISVYYFPTQAQSVFNANLSPLVSDWVSYTPTTSWVSNTTVTGKYRKVGDTLQGFVNWNLSGTPTNANLTWTLPAGLTVDTAKIAGTANQGVNIFGYGGGFHASAGLGNLMPAYNATSGTLQLVYQSSTGAATSVVNGTTGPVTWASGDTLNAYFEVPIVGWSSAISAPVVNNSITTNAAGAWRMETVGYAGTCSTSSCAATAGTGLATAITRNSTGNYTVTFASPYTSAPACLCSTNASFGCVFNAYPSTTSVGFSTFQTAGTVGDAGLFVMCQGPR